MSGEMFEPQPDRALTVTFAVEGQAVTLAEHLLRGAVARGDLTSETLVIVNLDGAEIYSGAAAGTVKLKGLFDAQVSSAEESKQPPQPIQKRPKTKKAARSSESAPGDKKAVAGDASQHPNPAPPDEFGSLYPHLAEASSKVKGLALDHPVVFWGTGITIVLFLACAAVVAVGWGREPSTVTQPPTLQSAYLRAGYPKEGDGPLLARQTRVDGEWLPSGAFKLHHPVYQGHILSVWQVSQREPPDIVSMRLSGRKRVAIAGPAYQEPYDQSRAFRELRVGELVMVVGFVNDTIVEIRTEDKVLYVAGSAFTAPAVPPGRREAPVGRRPRTPSDETPRREDSAAAISCELNGGLPTAGGRGCLSPPPRSPKPHLPAR